MDRTRQSGNRLAEIRPDHVERYEFARRHVFGRVLDAACGVGYGSKLLHDAGFQVVGVDISPVAIAHAEKHFPGPEYHVESLYGLEVDADCVVSLETLEHLTHPEIALRKFRQAKRLVCSVPNEVRYPFDASRFADDEYPHIRHYTPKQFDELLTGAGFRVTERYSQKTKHGGMGPGTGGMFLVYVCD